MQAFKIDNFLQANPGSSPPKFVHLTDAEATQLLKGLLLQAGPPMGTHEEKIRWLSERATLLADVNLERDELALRLLFKELRISPGPGLYLQWGALRDVDRFQTEELDKYFYDVWYPVADDIEIFDDTLAWMIFVRHYGVVEIWRRS